MEGGEPGSASVASRAVFRLDETFRARVDFNATHFSSIARGELALAVFPAADRPGTGVPEDLILIGNGTLDREPAPAGRKWVAVRSSGGEIEAMAHSSTGESTGTLYLDYADGVFHVGPTGYGQPNALASFALDDWTGTDLVTIALLAFSDGQEISPRNAAYFESFAIERSPAATFAEWADAVAEADSADPAGSAGGGDVPNLVRYAVGAGPYEPVLPHLPAITGASGDGHRIEFRRNARAGDVVVTLESSEDLVEWTAIATGNPGAPLQAADGQPYTVQESPLDGALTAITITPTDPVTPPSRTFYRLRVKRTDEPDPSSGDMVPVAGGTLSTSNSLDGTVISSFHISRFPVTWGEWQEVRAWAANNGYDLDGIGDACQANYPVSFVNWYDALKWCNAKSEMEGLEPVYRTDRGSIYRIGERPINQNLSANGYRLPQEAEWEFAASGGNQSQGFTYSGSDDLDEVGWYVENSGGAECAYNDDRGTWPVGLKAPNELGLYDMSGNVWEWCWPADETTRRVRGGGYNSGASSAVVSGRFGYEPHHRFSFNGFRLAQNAGE